MSDARQQRGTPTGAGTPGGGPPVIVSPPVGWPQPPPPTNAYYAAQPAEMESLRREKDDLANKLNYRKQEVEKLNAEISSLKGQVRETMTTQLHST